MSDELPPPLVTKDVPSISSPGDLPLPNVSDLKRATLANIVAAVQRLLHKANKPISKGMLLLGAISCQNETLISASVPLDWIFEALDGMTLDPSLTIWVPKSNNGLYHVLTISWGPVPGPDRLANRYVRDRTEVSASDAESS